MNAISQQDFLKFNPTFHSITNTENYIPEPRLASESTLSFPWRPQWHGIHWRTIFLPCSISWSIHHSSSLGQCVSSIISVEITVTWDPLENNLPAVLDQLVDPPLQLAWPVRRLYHYRGDHSDLGSTGERSSCHAQIDGQSTTPKLLAPLPIRLEQFFLTEVIDIAALPRSQAWPVSRLSHFHGDHSDLGSTGERSSCHAQ
ncbi:hypothetical protein GE061_004248 [Apolygus lucorum]|uniref:Uncharacterized protein n=1 Tax=Apolygus lucorum TaxID=248454 RepID=A0A8S9WYU2_APOLU|nr:hypothetical protein GE061_004248 [Apolygus lucorum]